MTRILKLKIIMSSTIVFRFCGSYTTIYVIFLKSVKNQLFRLSGSCVTNSDHIQAGLEARSWVYYTRWLEKLTFTTKESILDVIWTNGSVNWAPKMNGHRVILVESFLLLKSLCLYKSQNCEKTTEDSAWSFTMDNQLSICYQESSMKITLLWK